MGFWNFLLNRWTILAIGALLMMIGLKPDWTMAVVRMTGKMGWAENKIGQGGTFSIWKLIGVLAPMAAIIYFFSPGVHFEDNSTQFDNADTGTYTSSNTY